MNILLQAFTGLNVIYFLTIHFCAIIINLYFEILKYFTQKDFAYLKENSRNE